VRKGKRENYQRMNQSRKERYLLLPEKFLRDDERAIDELSVLKNNIVLRTK
jgi:hypothetical protein